MLFSFLGGLRSEVLPWGEASGSSAGPVDDEDHRLLGGSWAVFSLSALSLDSYKRLSL